MHYSLTISASQVFAAIVVFAYYDGPETGIAQALGGQWFRFKSLGDSKSLHFRAFLFEAIDGDWSNRVAELFPAEQLNGTGLYIVAREDSKALRQLEHEIDLVPPKRFLISVGPADMSAFKSLEIEQVESDQIQNVCDSERAFGVVHRAIKRANCARSGGGAQ